MIMPQATCIALTEAFGNGSSTWFACLLLIAMTAMRILLMQDKINMECKVARPASACAVSLRLLRALAAHITQELGPDASTTDVVQKYVKPRTAAAKLRFVDVLADSCGGSADVAVPQYFASHAWSRYSAQSQASACQSLW